MGPKMTHFPNFWPSQMKTVTFTHFFNSFHQKEFRNNIRSRFRKIQKYWFCVQKFPIFTILGIKPIFFKNSKLLLLPIFKRLSLGIQIQKTLINRFTEDLNIKQKYLKKRMIQSGINFSTDGKQMDEQTVLNS